MKLLFAWPGMLLLAGVLLGRSAGDDLSPMRQAAVPHGQKADRVWKRYHNAEQGYCIDYPSRWAKGDAFDGSGLYVRTGLRRYSKPLGEIDVAPITLAGPEDARLKPASLTDSLLEHWEGLQKFTRAERLQVISKREFKIAGYAALYAKNQYYDPLERRDWLEEVVFVNRQGQVYRLELQCSPDQIARFEPVFAYFVKTLQFDCK